MLYLQLRGNPTVRSDKISVREDIIRLTNSDKIVKKN